MSNFSKIKIIIFLFYLICLINNINCLENQIKCPKNFKTCYLFDGYGCCPYINGVCCNDLKHCCPEGYKCSNNGGCLKNKEYDNIIFK